MPPVAILEGDIPGQETSTERGLNPSGGINALRHLAGSMAMIVTFTVPAEAFPLRAVFTAFSDVTIELERIVLTQTTIIPYAWIRDESIGKVTTLLHEHPAVVSTTIVDDLDSQVLIKITWDPDSEGLVKIMSVLDMTILSEQENDTEWTFEVRVEDSTVLTDLQRYCKEHDIPLTFTTIQRVVPMETYEPELTDAQREALLAAYEAGYFNSPREATLEEVGERLGISRQAVADRTGAVGGSLDRYTRKFFDSQKLRQIVQYAAVFLGGPPKKTPRLYHMMSHIDLTQGVYYPEGGWSVVSAVADLARDLDVAIETNVEVTEVARGRRGFFVAANDRIWRADAVVSDADYAHTELELLPEHERQYTSEYWEKREYGPSAIRTENPTV